MAAGGFGLDLRAITPESMKVTTYQSLGKTFQSGILLDEGKWLRGRAKVRSMKEVDRIEDQLRRSLEGEAWHGASLNELLSDLSAAEAAASPVPNAHSIWEIVLHITSTQRLVWERLQGNPTVYADDQDWPPVRERNDAAWSSTLRLLRDTNRQLTDAVSELDSVRLDESIVEGFSSVYVTLHGAVQHNLYHAGQIALLKKAVRSTR